jgi:hypothetical protein
MTVRGAYSSEKQAKLWAGIDPKTRGYKEVRINEMPIL